MHGRRSTGKILAAMAAAVPAKLMDADGWMTEIAVGMMMVAQALVRTLKVMHPAALPPRRPVMTAAADAVGQMKQIIAHSKRILAPLPGLMVASTAKRADIDTCMVSMIRCQRWSFMSWGDTLRNWRKSRALIRTAWPLVMSSWKNGPAGYRAGVL